MENENVTKEKFALLCYLELCGDISTKSPDYLEEKRIMLSLGYDAFGFLDIHHMRNVVKWHTVWQKELPQVIYQYWKEEEDAARELAAKGFEI